MDRWTNESLPWVNLQISLVLNSKHTTQQNKGLVVFRHLNAERSAVSSACRIGRWLCVICTPVRPSFNSRCDKWDTDCVFFGLEGTVKKQSFVSNQQHYKNGLGTNKNTSWAEINSQYTSRACRASASIQGLSHHPIYISQGARTQQRDTLSHRLHNQRMDPCSSHWALPFFFLYFNASIRCDAMHVKCSDGAASIDF